MAITDRKEVVTMSFNETIKGWTSFHTIYPDWMLGMNNEFYSFKNGDLYIHHQDDVPRNNFYGVQYDSKISMMVNSSPSDIKEIKAFSLEGNKPWSMKIKAYVREIDDFTESSILTSEFINKEGIWYAYARRNEDPKQVDSKSAYGIGVVTHIEGNQVYVLGGNSLITQNDVVANENMDVLGTIENSEVLLDQIILTLSDTSGISVDDFLIGVKDARIEGGNLRGYTIRLDLTNSDVSKVELFAVNTEISKSFP